MRARSRLKQPWSRVDAQTHKRAAVVSAPDNPMGTDGFEFVEYTAPDTAELGRLFAAMGLRPVGRHRSKDVTLWRQGGVNFVVNGEAESFAQSFARVHGPSVCAFGFRVADAAAALERAVALGARAVEARIGPMELNIPAIEGIGGSLIYLVDRYGDAGSIWDVDFRALEGESLAPDRAPEGVGLFEIDHLTHNVHRGRMDAWSAFYAQIFGFREIRSFDIEGRHSGLHSRAMVSPCGRIRIPINESADDRSQIAEYLAAYRGEGIQHIALASRDIAASVTALGRAGVPFLAPPPASYYARLDERLPGHGENAATLQRLAILMDGEPGGGRLLQIFTATIFFEVIQRKGNNGFGEGNFRALFEAMEQDQIAHGRLKV